MSQRYSSRWLNRDPVGEEGGVNLYLFVDNSPMVEIDYFGLIGWGPPGGPAQCTPSGVCTPRRPPGATSISAGFGIYAIFGAEMYVTRYECCEWGKKYQVTVLTVCGGLGTSIGAGKGVATAPAKAPAMRVKAGPKANRGCPSDRYYVKGAISAGTVEGSLKSVGGGGKFAGGGHLEGDGATVLPPTIGVRYVFCSDTVLSMKAK